MRTQDLSDDVKKLLEKLIEERRSEIVAFKKPYHPSKGTSFADVIEWLIMKEKQSREKEDLIRSVLRIQAWIDVESDEASLKKHKDALKNYQARLKSLFNIGDTNGN